LQLYSKWKVSTHQPLEGPHGFFRNQALRLSLKVPASDHFDTHLVTIKRDVWSSCYLSRGSNLSVLMIKVLSPNQGRFQLHRTDTSASLLVLVEGHMRGYKVLLVAKRGTWSFRMTLSCDMQH